MLHSASKLIATALLALLVRPVAAQLLDDLMFVEYFRGVAGVTSITHAGDGSGRLFITEQVGRVLIHDGQSLIQTPFLDIRDRVQAGGERGLLSVAFHPNYLVNGYLFVNYTDHNSDTVVSRFQVTEDPNAANPASESTFFQAEQPRRNHNGGQLQFGPDGYLYVGMGDGGGAGDPPNLAQDLGSPLGKMLRLDVDQGSPAVAPGTNPFMGTVDVLPEIWAYGLRNPWRFSFDRLTGEMFIADVGQNRMEEVSCQAADSTGGENYGWRLMEGSLCFRPPAGCNDGSLVLPILEYENHGGNCGGSVTGGYRYRGSQYPHLSGVYFYADYCTGDFYGAVEEDGAWRALGPRPTSFNIRTFGEDEAGELYFADPSVVYRIEASPPKPWISDGDVVNAASLVVGPGLVPGSLATVFGIGLATTTAAADGSPLPTELGGGSMTFNGTVHAPQVFAAPGQRNFQVPWELAGLNSAGLTVSVGEDVSPQVIVPLSRVSPGVFVLSQSGQAAAVIASNGSIVAGPSTGFLASRPAWPGEILIVYATGLGAVTNPPATGVAALADPPSATLNQVEVIVGDLQMPVVSSVLDPSYVGLYRVSFRLSGDIPTGDAVPLVVRAGGVDSNTTFIAVERPEVFQ